MLDGYLRRRENGTEREYYHINWGWNGARDGYYFCGTFDTTCGRFKDSNIDRILTLIKVAAKVIILGHIDGDL